MNKYIVSYSREKPLLTSNWNDIIWKNSEIAELLNIRPEGSDHIPKVKVKLLYNALGIYGIFSVEDNYMICKGKNPMDSVWLDSCVEFFVKPPNGGGYFNFEFNCLGVLYASYVVDYTRTAGGFKNFTRFSSDDCRQVKTAASLKKSFEVEIAEPVNWTVQFDIPFELLEEYSGKIETNADGWTCNFNKCADDSSRPHWITWSPIRECNFHDPESFGKLLFKK